MLTQSRIILGGDLLLTEKAKILFDTRFKIKNIIQTDSKTAELTKYMNNTFFATKVSIMNEFKHYVIKLKPTGMMRLGVLFQMVE